MGKHLRPAALAAAALVGLMAASPAYAAPLTGGTANAANLTLGEQDTGTTTGTYSAQYDGQETTTGQNQPAVSLLTGQSLVGVGTLAQDADADASGSKACAGLAGRGASLARVGEGDCLTGGDVVSLGSGNIDLSKLSIDDGKISGSLPPEAQQALAQVIGPVSTAVQGALTQALTQLGNPSLSVDLGAVEGRCTAGDGGVTGDTRLANAKVVLDPGSKSGQQPITLLTLPEKPAPNTDYTADLGQLSDLVLKDVKANLEQSLGGALGPAAAIVDQTTVINGILSQLSTQLQPLTSKVVSIRANVQQRAATAIDLTALDVRVLPGAVQGVDAAHLTIGHVTCGPTTQAVVSPPEQAQQAAPLPRAVSAGEAGTPHRSPYLLPLVGLSLLAAASVGLAGWRGARR